MQELPKTAPIEIFITDLITEKKSVYVFLVNGVKLRGRITAWGTTHVPHILLQDEHGNSQLVFLVNTTTICPMTERPLTVER